MKNDHVCMCGGEKECSIHLQEKRFTKSHASCCCGSVVTFLEAPANFPSSALVHGSVRFASYVHEMGEGHRETLQATSFVDFF